MSSCVRATLLTTYLAIQPIAMWARLYTASSRCFEESNCDFSVAFRIFMWQDVVCAAQRNHSVFDRPTSVLWLYIAIFLERNKCVYETGGSYFCCMLGFMVSKHMKSLRSSTNQWSCNLGSTYSCVQMEVHLFYVCLLLHYMIWQNRSEFRGIRFACSIKYGNAFP